ncbi:MAG: DUF4864 domain-containing protein [Planctomycetia bacterium]|nr:DUF4864 domain-containing protein [Planctomycetia bacterium]
MERIGKLGDEMYSSGSKSHARVILWLLGGGLAGLLFLTCFCGGLVLLIGGFRGVASSVTEVQASSDKFLDCILHEDLQAAYQCTSMQYQGNITNDQFRSVIRGFPQLQESRSRSYTQVFIRKNTGRSTANVKGVLNTSGKSVTFSLTLVYENGQWKIDSFSIP